LLAPTLATGEFVPPKPKPKEERALLSPGAYRIGHVVWYDKAKRYGMIRDAENGEELFFHRSSLAGAANSTGLLGVKPGTCTSFTVGIDPKGRRCCDWIAISPGIVNCPELEALMVDQGGTELRRPTADERLDMTLEALDVTTALPAAVLKVEFLLANGDAIEFPGAGVRIGKGSNAYVVIGDAQLLQEAWLTSPSVVAAAGEGGSSRNVEEDAVEAIMRAPMTAREVVSGVYDRLGGQAAEEGGEAGSSDDDEAPPELVAADK